MFEIFMYCFLVIFMATATLSLASLPGWVRLPETYRRPLFTCLILEVVGCVVGFVWVGVRLQGSPELPSITESLLRRPQTWYWQYSARNWTTEAKFIQEDKRLTYTAVTYYRRDDAQKAPDNKPIFKWESLEDIRIPPQAGEIEFLCKQTILPSVKEFYGEGAPTPGEYKTKVRLRLVPALEGGFTVLEPEEAKGLGGGIMLAPNF